MIVVDRTSFMALADKVADSAIQRAIDDSDVPFIYMAYETGLEAGLTSIGIDRIEGPPHLLQRIEETELTVLSRTTARSAAARAMFEQFGVGHHPTSRLTLGDCAAFTLAVGMSGDLVCETSELRSMTVIYRLCCEWYLKQGRVPRRDFKSILTMMHKFGPHEGEPAFEWEARLKGQNEEFAAEMARTKWTAIRDRPTCCSLMPAKMKPGTSKHLSLTFRSDPDHGWLGVERKHIAELRICHRISADSYVCDWKVFLEKDYDMPQFLEAAERFGWTVTLKESHCDSRHNIRNMPRYEPPPDPCSPTQQVGGMRRS
jgi:uncharacterized protein with PIN domain